MGVHTDVKALWANDFAQSWFVSYWDSIVGGTYHLIPFRFGITLSVDSLADSSLYKDSAAVKIVLNVIDTSQYIDTTITYSIPWNLFKTAKKDTFFLSNTFISMKFREKS